jgi:hypothetical protein
MKPSPTCITIFGDVRHTEGCAEQPHPCDHHPNRTAAFTNAADSANIHFLAVFFYCKACGRQYLNKRARDQYKVGQP